MKVIFLDIDGVLNHERHYKWLMETDEPTLLQSVYPYSEFNPKSCRLLMDIIRETGAQIVVSSSWRLDGENRLNSLFKFFGLPRIYDITPCLNTARGIEIGAWLAAHPEVTNYVILDDDEDMNDEQKPFFIKTNPYEDGLNEACKDKAIELLNVDVDQTYRDIMRRFVDTQGGYPDDLLYAWGVANNYGWVRQTDQSIIDSLMTNDNMNRDIAEWYNRIIQVLVTLGPEKSKQYILEDFDVDGWCLPWDEKKELV